MTLPVGYSISPIGREHIEGFHRCLDIVSRERRYLGAVEAPPLDRVRDFVEGNISSSAQQYVALLNRNVVGWCDILPGKKMPGFGHTGVLGMGVHPDHRGRGLGRALLDRTVTGAKDTGLRRVELEVYASNVPAISLYLRSGFVVEGCKRRARYLDGQYDDIILMARWIGSEAG
ncbi:MAG: GNAT family N-acetyltransferase [Chloroflexi bacterium]|nr:GNAT family N-acetyltransferase [Chloroflexota bacterium]